MGSSATLFVRTPVLMLAVAAVVISGAVVASTPASATSVDTTFGPDGTHYPSATPDIRTGSAAYTIVDVPASASAIRTALDSLTAQEIDAGAIIRVAPGDIPSMTPLNGYSNTRAEKVLITARDGFDSVTGSIGWRFTDVRGITVMRFDLAELDVKGATHCSFAWMRLSNHYFGAAGSHGVPVHDVEFLEMVEPAAVLKSSDSAQIKAYAPDSLTDVVIDGAYIAPSFYIDGVYDSTHPRPHTDSLQIEGDGIGASSVVIHDTAIFASNNSAVIIGGVPGVTFDHALVVAGGKEALRYPFLAGGAGSIGAIQGPGSLSAIQGSGGGDVTATDSIFIGSLQPVWADVESTLTDQKNKSAAKGGFTTDAALTAWSAADLDRVSPLPTTDYLRGIWDDVASGAGEALDETPPLSQPEAPEGAASPTPALATQPVEIPATAASPGASRPTARQIAAARSAHATALKKSAASITRTKKLIRLASSARLRSKARAHLAALRQKRTAIKAEWSRLESRYR